VFGNMGRDFGNMDWRLGDIGRDLGTWDGVRGA
jgi:hypothetical protein